MKLIDADALRQAILSTMPERSEVLLIVDNQPDAVVRCKDCKQGEQSVLPNRHLWCRIHEFYREPDWYCADGEMKEGDGE